MRIPARPHGLNALDPGHRVVQPPPRAHRRRSSALRRRSSGAPPAERELTGPWRDDPPLRHRTERHLQPRQNDGLTVHALWQSTLSTTWSATAAHRRRRTTPVHRVSCAIERRGAGERRQQGLHIEPRATRFSLVVAPAQRGSPAPGCSTSRSAVRRSRPSRRRRQEAARRRCETCLRGRESARRRKSRWSRQVAAGGLCRLDVSSPPVASAERRARTTPSGSILTRPNGIDVLDHAGEKEQPSERSHASRGSVAFATDSVSWSGMLRACRSMRCVALVLVWASPLSVALGIEAIDGG
jgi:hypothetical protein